MNLDTCDKLKTESIMVGIKNSFRSTNNTAQK